MLICDRCLKQFKDEDITEGVCIECWPLYVKHFLDREGII